MKEYFAQYGQDKFLDKVFFSKIKNGIFIDIGAYDGIRFSNSYFFEKYKNWKGVCVEPNPKVFQKLSKNRNCTLINACIHDVPGSVIFRVVQGYGEMLSGIQFTYDDRHKARIEKTIKQFGGAYEEIEVPSITILEILDKEKFNQIDFLSIDTEGNEINILRSFPFSRMKPKVIVVENNFQESEIQNLLKDQGYVKCMNLESDDIYCHSDFYSTAFKMSIIFFRIKRSLKYRFSKLFNGNKN